MPPSVDYGSCEDDAGEYVGENIHHRQFDVEWDILLAGRGSADGVVVAEGLDDGELNLKMVGDLNDVIAELEVPVRQRLLDPTDQQMADESNNYGHAKEHGHRTITLKDILR